MKTWTIAPIAVCWMWVSSAGAAEPGTRSQAPRSDTILEQLRAISGLTVVELPSQPGTRGFLLNFTQPIDHAHPSRGSFSQRAVLLHRDVSKPMVLSTTGYGLWSLEPRDNEVSYLLQANSLVLEHRFFEGSMPDPVDWSFLTIRQAAEDHHRVVTLLKGLYHARWLSTGGSKGGMTSLYHRRFFPHDVQGTIAYVAPQSYGTDDPRYPAFLERVGSASCRSRVVAFQLAVLARRSELIPLFQTQANDWGLTYQRVGGLDIAFEHAAQEFRFALRQYFDEAFCDTLPAPDAPADELAGILDWVAGPANLASDQVLAFFDGYYYQASAQLGSYGPLETHLHSLLQFPGTYRVERYSPAPVDHFDVRAMPEVQVWLALFGERVMLIYGGDDPWSAGAFELGHARDSFRYVIPGANHGTAGISTLAEPQQLEALAALSRWAGAPIAATVPTVAAEGQRASKAIPPGWQTDRDVRRAWRPGHR